VVPGSHHFQGSVVHLFAVVRPQPRRPARPRNRKTVQKRQPQVSPTRQGVDPKIRHVMMRRRRTMMSMSIMIDGHAVSAGGSDDEDDDGGA